MRLTLPPDPYFGDLFVSVAPQPDVAVDQLSLRSLPANRFFQLAEDVGITARNFDRYDSPFNIGADAAQLTHFDSLAGQHRNLSEHKSLIRQTGAGAQRSVA